MAMKLVKWCSITVLTLGLLLATFASVAAERTYLGKKLKADLYIDGIDPCLPLAHGRMQLKPESALFDPDRRRAAMSQLVATIVGSECPGTQTARIDFLNELEEPLECLIASKASDTSVSWRVEVCPVPALPFGIAFWIEIGFVCGLLILAFIVFRWANSVQADAWLQLPTSIGSVAQVLFDLDGQGAMNKQSGALASYRKQGMVVLGGDEMSMRFKVPTYPGIFHHEGALARSVIAHVPVPPGMIARMETKVGSVSMSRVLDTGRVLTIKDENLGEKWVGVLALERSARWQVSIKNGIRTNDDYLVRLHVAVHSWIQTPVDDPVIERVFEEYSNYRTEVQLWVRNVLEGILREQSYDYSLRHCDEIIESLNRQWRDAGATRLSEELRGAITTKFTALVIKPRQEAEQTRFRPIFNRIQEIEREVSDTNSAADYQINELKNRIENAIRSIETYIINLDGYREETRVGQVEYIQSDVNFKSRLKESANAAGKHLERGAERDKVHQIVRSPFEEACKSLTNAEQSYVEACTELADLIRLVRTEQKSRLREESK